MINLSDKLTAKTIDHVVADSHEIEYEKGKTTTKGNTVADELTNLANSKVNSNESNVSIIKDNDDTFYFADGNRNVIAKITKDGLQSIKFLDKDGNEIVYTSIEKSIKDKIKQDGFYFTDAAGNVIASIDKKGIHAVNIYEDGSNTPKSGWLNGKTIFSLCDSLGAGGAWQTLLAEMSGAKFDQKLNGSQENMNNGTSLSMGGAATLNTLFYGYEGYPKGLSSQQQRAMNFVKLDETVYGAKDLLLIENINDLNYFRDVDKAEDITSIPSIFVKHTPIFKDRIFATAVTARDYFTKNYVDVLTGIEPNVGTSLNFQIQTKGYDLTINSGATTAGTFTVNIGSESYPITVNSGMSAKEIAQSIYAFRFNGFKTSIDGATVKLTAELDDYIEATITCETDTDATYSLNRTENGLSYYPWVFKSHDVKGWQDISNWDYAASLGFISAVKGLFEYLAAETPKTKIVYVIAPRFMHKWNKFLRTDGTVDMEAYNNDEEVASYNEFIKAQIKVCELYNIEYVNLAKELGWNQANMKRVYGEGTIHWNSKGSEDIANFLFRKLN